MCNIAGYVGERKAAPILLEMMKREEGYAGGYNTGIATLCGGKIEYRKLVGSTDLLIKNTDALELEGNIGICHSRSKSHSGVEWAHPFVGFDNGEIACAYIANGNPAKKSDPANERKYAKMLHQAGYTMISRIENHASKAAYPQLEDGSKVHSSDVICQLAFKYTKEGFEAPKALEKAFYDIVAERVGLFLTRDNPDRIAWARINMPVFVAFAPHGAYIASTPLAFPDDAGEPQLLLPNSSGWLYADRITQSPFEKINLEVPPMDAAVLKKGYDIITSELENGPQSFNDLLKPLGVLFDNCECMIRAALIYSVLYSLKKQGLLSIETRLVEPIFSGIDVPKFFLSLKKKGRKENINLPTFF